MCFLRTPVARKLSGSAGATALPRDAESGKSPNHQYLPFDWTAHPVRHRADPSAGHGAQLCFLRMNFEELKLAPAIVKAVREQGYETPTPIQAQAIPAVLEGHDILGGAQTGTGKTAAFTLPMLHK